MKNITFDYASAMDFLAPHELEYMGPKIEQAHELLHERRGAGNEYTGWLNIASDVMREDVKQIKEAAGRIQEMADVFIVVGIGGSYLGARAAIEALNHNFHNYFSREKRNEPAVIFAGNHLSSTYLSHLMDLLAERDVAVNVISKSGTTLEPAIAFRLIRSFFEERYGKDEAGKRIFVTTDRDKGLLKEMAVKEGYETFVIPGDVGGRYSVITPVGLLPMAVSGIDIEKVLEGYREGKMICDKPDWDDNPAYIYAAVRNLLYARGKLLEVLVSYEPYFHYIAEWWKQLFGESEGKDGKGIFPVNMGFTTDLHSMGQYLQEGRRHFFVTSLWQEEPACGLSIPALVEDDDGLNYLADTNMHEVNEKAWHGTVEAHTAGGVPNLTVKLPEMNPFYFGQLVYFFMKTCAVSGYLMGVNPFDQPGVEAYKRNMFTLLRRK